MENNLRVPEYIFIYLTRYTYLAFSSAISAGPSHFFHLWLVLAIIAGGQTQASKQVFFW